MKYRKAVKVLTYTSAFLCGSSFAMALSYLLSGAIWPAVLDFAAALLTGAGAVYGVWWLCEGWKDKE